MGNNMVTANRGKGTEGEQEGNSVGNNMVTANRGKGTEGEQKVDS